MGESEQEYSSGDSEAWGPYISFWLRGNTFHAALQVSLTCSDLFRNGRTKRHGQTKVSGHNRGEAYQSLILPHRRGGKTFYREFTCHFTSVHSTFLPFLLSIPPPPPMFEALKHLLSFDLLSLTFWNLTYSITHQPGYERVDTKRILSKYWHPRNLTYKCIRTGFSCNTLSKIFIKPQIF